MAQEKSFISILLKLGNFVDLINDLLKIQNELTDGDTEPVDLHPLAETIHEILNDFGLQLPPWANNIGTIMTFMEGGINAVAAAKTISIVQPLEGHADMKLESSL